MNPTTSLDNNAARAHPATLSKDKEDAYREILRTYSFEWIDRGIGTDETPLYTLGQGRETLPMPKHGHSAERTRAQASN
jgi:hypothetical protein